MVTGLLITVTVLLVGCDDKLPFSFLSNNQELKVSPLAEQLGFSKERPLVMGMNTSYAPLQYVDNQGRPSGFDVEFTQILMRRMGIPFTFSPNHWDKMSPGIIEGKYDLGMLVYSSYRKELTNYSDAVFRLYYQIVYRKEDYANFDFRHLKGKRIAYMKSRPIGLMLKDAEADDYSVTDLAEAIKDLSEGKYDGVICYRFQAKYNIEQLHLNSVLTADELSLEPREYCYASHDSVLIACINAELKRMEEEGIIAEVYGDEVVSHFGAIEIPNWVWGLLVVLTFVFLIVFSVNRHLMSKRLRAAHQSLQVAYDQMAEKNEQLLIANARAEESTRMKSAFIKQISHEIRTPLNILSGFTQLLTHSGTVLSDEEKSDAAKQILESTDRITGLVNKMLELSEVSSEVVIERTDEVTSAQIAQQAVLASGIAEAPHLLFELKLEEGAEQPLVTNLRSAARVVELLLDNAKKYTHPAEAYLPQMKLEKKERATLIVSKGRFVIEDTGVGIPEEEKEHIFDEFVQLDEYYDGTGIGLTVARSLARRLGGDIVLDTTYNEGARFVVMLSV
ncbi:MAG: transporter substrate-binding domain-containing protein [Prevotella sp.]|nr:transporter substrate-binding domain-containing protein [Prevotella sp.]